MDAFQLFLCVLSVYLLFLVLTGVYFSKKQVTGADFWLAGRLAGWLFIGFSAAASLLTAGALLAVIGFFILLGMGSVRGLVAPNILALAIIAFFRKKKNSTIACHDTTRTSGAVLRKRAAVANCHLDELSRLLTALVAMGLLDFREGR